MVLLAFRENGTDEAKKLIAQWASPADHITSRLRTNNNARQNFLLSRALLRKLLFTASGHNKWQIDYDAKGKPYCIGNNKATFHLSVSHSRNLVACGLSQKYEIGIDVEYWRPRNFTALANFAFGSKEQEAVKNGGTTEFYRIWTMREAMAKASGNGIMAEIDGTNRTCGNYARNWQFEYAIQKKGYSFAMALKTNGNTPEAMKWL